MCTSSTLLIPNFLPVSAREIAALTKNIYPLKNKEIGQKLDRKPLSIEEIQKLVTPAHQTHREKKRWKVEKFQHIFSKLRYHTNNYKLVVQKCMFIIATLNWGPNIETANSGTKFHFFQLEPAGEVGGAI